MAIIRNIKKERKLAAYGRRPFSDNVEKSKIDFKNRKKSYLSENKKNEVVKESKIIDKKTETEKEKEKEKE